MSGSAATNGRKLLAPTTSTRQRRSTIKRTVPPTGAVIPTSKSHLCAASLSQDATVPHEFCEAVKALEMALGMPVWLLVQRGESTPMGEIGPTVNNVFFNARKQIATQGPVALVVHSLGGYAHCAYRIARLFQLGCSEFSAIVPRRAKSAATLLSLGAKEIYFGPFAELGPLDAQLMDHDREQLTSALDEVKALDRLHASSLEAVDQLVMALLVRTGKKIDSILPAALNFVAETNKPLLDKIDTIHFTQMSRILKEAEEYAKRLMYKNYSQPAADRIATQLVESYPTHSFMIDFEEAKKLGINVSEVDGAVANAIDDLIPFLDKVTALGRLV